MAIDHDSESTKLSYYNKSWKLISQGAEARVWLVPDFIVNSDNSAAKSNNITKTAICKERFPKKYRHPTLDESLTKSRTKAEARNLTKCRRGGVSVPLILGIDMTKGKMEDGESKSACLFLEFVDGCTIRNYLNVEECVSDSESKYVSSTSQEQEERPSKIRKTESDENNTSPKKEIPNASNKIIKKIITRVDESSKKVAYAVGIAVGKMHNVNIIHGDLTTSNILLRNPPSADTSSSQAEETKAQDWDPDIVLIDFGLSSSSANSKKKTSCHEERAVDLYVLERAFITTHVGSEELVGEVMRGYKASCQSSDSVFVRLAQVRARGRKRECFG